MESYTSDDLRQLYHYGHIYNWLVESMPSIANDGSSAESGEDAHLIQYQLLGKSVVVPQLVEMRTTPQIITICLYVTYIRLYDKNN